MDVKPKVNLACVNKVVTWWYSSGRRHARRKDGIMKDKRKAMLARASVAFPDSLWI
jgi:hypothetical protein